jgi:hypothetical protein
MTSQSDNIDDQIMLARLDRRMRVLNQAKRMIWVTFQREGIHCYPAAGTDPNLADVSFLANPHRHIFHFHVAIEIFHNDRDIEFIQFKRWLESLYQGTLELDHKSCEMISDDLYNVIAMKYPNRDIEISVAEDNENGSLIRYHLSKPSLSTVI